MKIVEQSWAVRLGVALLIGYAAITGFAVYNKAHRTAIEKVETPTGVGDQAFYPIQQSFDPSVPLANFQGHSLYFVDWFNIVDSGMIRAGMDDTNSFFVYRLAGAKGAEASYFYLRYKANAFVKVKRQ